MPTQRPQPLIRIRVIGPAEHANRVLAQLADHVMPVLFGPNVVSRRHTRTANPAGHVRAYLTVAGKETEL